MSRAQERAAQVEQWIDGLEAHRAKYQPAGSRYVWSRDDVVAELDLLLDGKRDLISLEDLATASRARAEIEDWWEAASLVAGRHLAVARKTCTVAEVEQHTAWCNPVLNRLVRAAEEGRRPRSVPARVKDALNGIPTANPLVPLAEIFEVLRLWSRMRQTLDRTIHRLLWELVIVEEASVDDVALAAGRSSAWVRTQVKAYRHRLLPQQEEDLIRRTRAVRLVSAAPANQLGPRSLG